MGVKNPAKPRKTEKMIMVRYTAVPVPMGGGGMGQAGTGGTGSVILIHWAEAHCLHHLNIFR